jgi:hypothetical protein
MMFDYGAAGCGAPQPASPLGSIAAPRILLLARNVLLLGSAAATAAATSAELTLGWRRGIRLSRNGLLALDVLLPQRLPVAGGVRAAALEEYMRGAGRCAGAHVAARQADRQLVTSLGPFEERGHGIYGPHGSSSCSRLVAPGRARGRARPQPDSITNLRAAGGPPSLIH